MHEFTPVPIRTSTSVGKNPAELVAVIGCHWHFLGTGSCRGFAKTPSVFLPGSLLCDLMARHEQLSLEMGQPELAGSDGPRPHPLEA